MPTIKVYDMQGNVSGELALSENVFGAEVNMSAVHAVVRAYLLNQRQGTQSTLTRSEVSGGGRKPWRQKGTGRARQGSTRSPQWTHGGIALGPKPRLYKVSINKKVKRIALKSALSSKVNDGELIVIDNIALDEYKTKKVIAMLAAVNAGEKALIVTAENDPILIKSAANIPGVATATVNTINVYDILKHGSFGGDEGRHRKDRGGICIMRTAYDIIIKPVITEASMDNMQKKKYTFKVMSDANKIEIRKAVEELFGVKVEKVTTISMKAKPKRLGVHYGRTSAWKKAIVKLTEDSKTIEFFDSRCDRC